MKILCIADIHGEIDFISKLEVFAKEREIKNILILGDFTTYGRFRDAKLNSKDAEYILSKLKDSGFEVFAIPGNCDSKEILEVFDKFESNLHEKVINICGINFVGLGGSNPTPFNTPFEFSEEEIYEKLKGIITVEIKNQRNIVLITHCPPKDTHCDDTGSMNVGSWAMRKIIEEFQPFPSHTGKYLDNEILEKSRYNENLDSHYHKRSIKLVVCSHIHECGGEMDKIGKTQIANIGMLADMRCGIIDTKSLDIELMRM